MTARRSASITARALLPLAVAVSILLAATPARADWVRDAQWHLKFLNIAAAHKISQGQGITVAVIDTGVDARHPDLAGTVLPGVDLTAVGGNGHTDISGHGTAMAGLIAASGQGRGAGALGIAPEAKILPVRDGAFSHSGGRPVEGIRSAIQHGAQVICFASGGDPSPELEAAVHAALSADIVIVAAAGNRPISSKVGWPAAYPGVIAAAGVDRKGNHAEVSVTGPEVVLAAPAIDIVSTDKLGETGYNKGTGTSSATAIIAGAAALVRAKFPELSAAEVVHRLTTTATDKGPPGRDEQYGHGVLNLMAALTADVPPLQPSPQTTKTSEGTAPGPTVALPEPPAERTRPLLTGVTYLLLGAATLAALATTALLIRRTRRMR